MPHIPCCHFPHIRDVVKHDTLVGVQDEVSQAHITDSICCQQDTTIINESGLYNKERMLRFGTSFLWWVAEKQGVLFSLSGSKFYEVLSQLLTESLIERGTIVPECG